ncbi:MAG TPA: amidase [Bacteroidetes bacterium]|nr:amidase [Bacteroidota bacterium]
MSTPILTELNWKNVQETEFEIAILPWGATEAHNYHLPYGTDNYQVERIAARAASLAGEKGAQALVLPTVPFGVNCQQQDIPLTMNLNPSTQALLLEDLVTSVENSGISKMLILNGHGGNDFKQMIREIQASSPVFLCAANWYTMSDPADVFDHSGDHAGELETSMMMYLFPDLVRPLEEAADGFAKQFRIKAMKEKKVWAPRQWTSVTESTGVGNPYLSSVEKGSSFFDAVTTELAHFLVDLSTANIDDMYA